MSAARRPSMWIGMMLLASLAAATAWVSFGTLDTAADDGETPLQITLDVPEICEIDADGDTVTPNLNIKWSVQGGVEPYRIFVHGRYQADAVGAETRLCGIWSDRLVQSGQMPILARVIDANGDAASALAYTQAVRVIRDDGVADEFGFGLRSGETYIIHGLILTIPETTSFALGRYVSFNCDPDAAFCGDEFSLSPRRSSYRTILWLRRWHPEQPRYEFDERDNEEEYRPIMEELVASIGKPPATALLGAAQSGADSNDLEIELSAPAICETHWARQFSQQDIDVEWQVRGGRAPYRVQFADRLLEGDKGTMTIPCGVLRDDADGVNSQLMNTQAVVLDADGQMSSGVVSTYVISAGRYGGDRIYGGWTHRIDGLLMTIPEGITFYGDSFGYTFVDCYGDPYHDDEWEEEEDVTSPPSGALSINLPIGAHTEAYRCQNRWSMGGEWQIGKSTGTLWIAFGETTDDVVEHRTTLDEPFRDDPAAQGDLEELERRIETFANSIGDVPTLPDFGEYNPAPLRIIAWPTPTECWLHVDSKGERYAEAERRVRGGYWWPLGVGSEAWNDRLEGVSTKCGAEWGEYHTTFETHEMGPEPKRAETVVTHYSVPIFGDYDELDVTRLWWLPGYCEPGGTHLVGFEVRQGTRPYYGRINGAEVEVLHYNDGESGRGATEVTCADRLGLQAFTVEVWDSASPPNRVIWPLLLMVVEQHPSGLPWSEFD